MNRGDVWDADIAGGRRPVVIVTRDVVIPLLTRVTVAPVTNTVRGIPSEVPLGREEGLEGDRVANCDNLATIPKHSLRRRRGDLGPESLEKLSRALSVAFEITHVSEA